MKGKWLRLWGAATALVLGVGIAWAAAISPDAPLPGSPPTVTLLEPENGHDYTRYDSFTLRANAVDPDNDFASMTISVDGQTWLTSNDANTFIAYRGMPLSLGSHELSIVAIDQLDHASTPISIRVNVLPSRRPSVKLTSPVAGASSPIGTTITLTADAQDADGQIKHVEYFRNGRSLGTATTAPYTVQWTPAVGGTFELSAIATDDSDVASLPSSLSITVVDNQPPTVALDAPLPGTSVRIGTSVALAATASDVGGTVARVDFVVDNVVVASDFSSPYTGLWTATPVGPRAVSARAIDTSGNVASSGSVTLTVLANQAPSVALNAPANGATVKLGASVPLAAAASDPDGLIDRVEFLVDGVVVASDSTAPYTGAWNASPLGARAITARAVDDLGASTTSSTATLTVIANQAPTVALTSPANNAQLIVGLPVILRANAADADGSIASVQFRLGASGEQLLGSDTTAPYEMSWTPSTAGTFVLRARAADDSGATVDSATITVFVNANAAPTIQVNKPAYPNNIEFPPTVYQVGQVMALEARATDANQNLDRVEFLLNGGIIAESRPTSAAQTIFTASVPVNPNWVSPNVSFISARVYDTLGVNRTSELVPVAVIVPNPPRVPCAGPMIPNAGPAVGEFGCNGQRHLMPGTIQAERFDGGGQGVGYFDVDGMEIQFTYPRGFDVEIAAAGSGEDLPPEAFIYDMKRGEWFAYSLTTQSAGTYHITARLRAPTLSRLARAAGDDIDPPVDPIDVNTRMGVIEITDAQTAEVLERIDLPRTDALPTDWGDVILADVTLLQGEYVMTYKSLEPQEMDSIRLELIGGGGGPPVASISSPQSGSSYQVGANVAIEAMVQGALTGARVDFFLDGANTPFASDTNGAPYTATWVGATAGTHNLTARASNGSTVGPISPNVTITVSNNTPPTVAMTSPSNNASQPIGTPWTLAAAANDTDGVIAQVEFLLNGQPFVPPQIDTTPPFQVSWLPSTPGTYALSARATDNQGANTTSAAVNITVTGGIGLDHEIPDPVPASIADASDGVGATAGEFRVDESGSANYSIQLLTVPGRAGVVPSLSLSYNSQAPEGVLGRGFSIGGMSGISRCRQTAEQGDADALQSGSAPIGFDGGDRFCLDGQRLVVITGAYGANGSEYRTEIDSFARIRAYDPDGVNGPNFFIVQRKDGTTAWYGDRIAYDGLPFIAPGTTTVARPDAYLQRNDGGGVNLPAATDAAIHWALSRSMDSVGNYVDYVYDKDATRGQQLLARVDYTGKQQLAGQPGSPGNLPSFASVTFNYASLPAAEITRTYQNGMLIAPNKYLANVNAQSGATVVRQYRLSYGTSPSGSGARVLTQLQECASDAGNAVCYRPTTFTWSTAVHRALDEGRITESGSFNNYKGSKLGDVDGDGLLDFVWFEDVNVAGCPRQHVWAHFSQIVNNRLVTRRAPGASGFCSTRRIVDEINDAWYLIDFDGDGKDDLMIADSAEAVTPGTQLRWHVYRSRGRVSGPAFDVSQDLLPSCEASPQNCVPVTSNGALAQLADVNGDGLPDVYFSGAAPDSPLDDLKVKLMQRKASGTGFEFSRTHDVVLDWTAGDTCARAIEPIDDVPGEYFRGCGINFLNSSSTNGRSPQPTDLNADGRADLMLRVTQTFTVVEDCVNKCPVPSRQTQQNPPPYGADGVGFFNDKDYDREFADPDGRAPTLLNPRYSSLRSYYYPMRMARIEPAGAGNPRVVLTRYAPPVQAAVNNGAHPDSFTWYTQAQTADVNGDGLQDLFLYPTTTTQLAYQLNTGTGTWQLGSAITGLTGRDYLNIVDLNGDGRADLVHPTGSGDASTYRFRAANRDGTYPATSGALPGCSVGNPGCIAQGMTTSAWVHFFADFDGDGSTDYMSRHINDSNNNYDSARGLASDRHQPRDVITQITNGYGAATRLRYQPLTNGAVYVREINSRGSFVAGRGSPVQDLLAPLYVVARVDSDAPSVDNPSATAAVYYQYRGARVQGGGRGLLGFNEVRSIDANFSGQHVITITRYRQDFPFVGMPDETRKYLVSGTFTPSACLTGSPEPSCFTAGDPAANGSQPEPVGKLISYARNRLSYLSLNNGATTFPFIQASMEVAGNVDVAGLQTLSETVSYLNYDTWGNALINEAGVATGASYADVAALRATADARLAGANATARCGAGCVKRTETLSIFAPSDTDYWRLGRLTEATVTQWRLGAPSTTTRVTRFTYDSTGATRTGLLISERIQPGIALQDLRTVNLYDNFGNATYVFHCSGDVAESDCDGAEDAANMLQRPVGANDLPLSRVHRYTRSVYDSSGRFVAESRSPFFAGENVGGAQALEGATERATIRDALGNVLRKDLINANFVLSEYGPLGRLRRSSDAAFAESASEYHWCAGMNSGAQEASCPSGATFRVTTWTKGGTRGVTYFDKLGRQFLALTESFNRYDGDSGNDWIGMCTVYDTRGRSVRVSEPAFVAASVSGNLPTVTAANPCPTTQAATRTAFDALDRTTDIFLPEHTAGAPALTHMSYLGLTTTTQTQLQRDEDGNGTVDSVTMQQTETRDVTGKVTTVIDNEGLVTTYTYNSADLNTKITRDAGRGAVDNVIVFDALGRKTQQIDPDAGTVSYFYNAIGEQICARDARGFIQISDYDALGRVWRKRTDAGSCDLTTQATIRVGDSVFPVVVAGASRSHQVSLYDTAVNGLGLIARTETRQTTGETYGVVDTFKQTTSYDGLGRVIGTTTQITPPGMPTETYATATSYDALGRVAISTDITQGAIENMYSAHGFLRRVRDAANPSLIYWEVLAADARGQLTEDRRHGNARLTQRRIYNATTGRLSAIQSGEAVGGSLTANLQNLAYDFDAAGDVLARRDLRLNLEERFRYDRLNRLTNAEVRGINGNGLGPINTMALRYDKLGNICEKNARGYTYAGRAGCGLGIPGSGSSSAASPHAATQRALAGGAFITYGYDASGNQISADESTGTAKDRYIRYSSDGLADRIAVGLQSNPTEVTRFHYAGGSRYLRVDQRATGTSITRYIAGVEWISAPNGATERKRYIGGFLILTERGSLATPTREYRYTFTDHLGSIDTLVDENGVVRERLSFDAHGSRRDAEGAMAWQGLISTYTPAHTTRGFTGHEHVDLAGIVHMNGRLYDAALGRMLSPDPMVQEVHNAQNLNRYTYVLNNPLSFTDPSGLNFIKKYWRTIVAFAITIFAPYLGVTGFWGTVATGFVSGAVASGSLQGGLWGAFSAGLFYGIGSAFEGVASANGAGSACLDPSKYMANGLTSGQFAAKVLAHAVAGGVMGSLQGGKFGHGFLSAGFTQAFAPSIDAIGDGASGLNFQRIAAAAFVGGTASVLSGGKFANGALTGAFSRAFNDEMHDPDSWWSRFKGGAAQLANDLVYDRDQVIGFLGSDEVTNSIVGFGDGASFGISSGIRSLFDIQGNVDVESEAYKGGRFAGAVMAPTGRVGYILSIGRFRFLAATPANAIFASSMRNSLKWYFRGPLARFFTDYRPFAATLQRYGADPALIILKASTSNMYFNTLAATGALKAWFDYTR